jgi:lipopolysaccharide export LptBFGC system permease protein LptF
MYWLDYLQQLLLHVPLIMIIMIIMIIGCIICIYVKIVNMFTPIPYNIQEAYKMVDEAKGERFSAEKKLADATGQVAIYPQCDVTISIDRLRQWKHKSPLYTIYSKALQNLHLLQSTRSRQSVN